MGIFQRILGNIGSFFQIGGPNGPGWNANAGAFEAKNATNSAFAIVRCADPVGNNDCVNLEYFNAHSGGGGGALVLTRYVAAAGGILDPVTGNNTLATLVVPIVAGQTLDIEFDAYVNGAGDPGGQVQFLSEVDGTLINDQGVGAFLNEITEWPANTIGETQPWGGSYRRMARVSGLTTGNHTITLIGNASGSPVTPNVFNIAIKAYVVSA